MNLSTMRFWRCYSQILEDKIDNGKIVDQREISIKIVDHMRKFVYDETKKDIILTGLKLRIKDFLQTQKYYQGVLIAKDY